MGNQAVVSERACGCPYQELGWTTHLHDIRSFEKLTAGGIDVPGHRRDPRARRDLTLTLRRDFLRLSAGRGGGTGRRASHPAPRPPPGGAAPVGPRGADVPCRDRPRVWRRADHEPGVAGCGAAARRTAPAGRHPDRQGAPPPLDVVQPAGPLVPGSRSGLRRPRPGRRPQAFVARSNSAAAWSRAAFGSALLRTTRSIMRARAPCSSGKCGVRAGGRPTAMSCMRTS